MSDKDLENRIKDEDTSVDDFLKGLGIAVLIGGGLLAYWLATSPKGKTFIGGGLAATGAKMIKDNWNK